MAPKRRGQAELDAGHRALLALNLPLSKVRKVIDIVKEHSALLDAPTQTRRVTQRCGTDAGAASAFVQGRCSYEGWLLIQAVLYVPQQVVASSLGGELASCWRRSLPIALSYRCFIQATKPFQGTPCTIQGARFGWCRTRSWTSPNT